MELIPILMLIAIFIIPLFFNHYRWILVYFLLAAILIVVALKNLLDGLNHGDDGPGYIIAFGFLSLAFFTVTSGCLASSLMIKFPTKIDNKLKKAMIIFSSLLFPYAAIYGPLFVYWAFTQQL